MLSEFHHNFLHFRYDYYYREAYYDDLTSHESSLDVESDSYDPDYVHHHH